MCEECTRHCQEIFPEVPPEKISNFLFGTTCFPAGEPSQVLKQLQENRGKMKTNDWRECFAIAEDEIDEAYKKEKENERK